MAVKDLGESDSQNTARKLPEQGASNVQIKTWVDGDTSAEITGALREFFRSDNVSESVRLVLKGFARIKPMRDALHEDMAIALIGTPAGDR